MTITKIKILKNKVKVYFDKEMLELSKETYPNFYLYVGKDVSKKEFNEIKEYNNVSSLLTYALRIRNKVTYSEFKMREKLYNKGANKKEVDKVIKTLKSYDLIDDNAFTLDLVSYYDSLNYGKNKIISKLKEKGIFEENISKLKFSELGEIKKANNLLPKLEKKYDKYNYSSRKDHIYKAYIDLGFSSEIATSLSNKIKKSTPREEKEKLKKDYLRAKTRLMRKYKGNELKEKLYASMCLKGYKYSDINELMEEEE